MASTPPQVSTFDVELMTNLLDGGANLTTSRRKVQEIVSREPLFRYDTKYYLDRRGQYAANLDRLRRFVEMSFDGSLSGLSQVGKEQFKRWALFNDPNPVNMHELGFIGLIKFLGTDEQGRKWLPLAESYSILGSYAQTEIAHGSDVQGLETTATYDASKDEIILNSPTFNSMKWWPGLLGRTATHAVVHARLIVPNPTNGKQRNYGVQAFIVQLRDLETHKTLPGIEAGDIGPKFGLNKVDNGYCRFNNLKISRDQMLMRYCSLSADGKVKFDPNGQRLLYIALMRGRVGISRDCVDYMTRAGVIAARYCAIRKQFRAKTGAPELPVISYQNVQMRLFPVIADMYVLKVACNDLFSMYESLAEGITKATPDFSLLAPTHANSCGLKAIVSMVAADNIENCRRICGGHGYSAFSGIGDLLQDMVSLTAAEGDNYMIAQQTSRYILKEFETMKRTKIQKGASWVPPHSSLSYLTLLAGGQQPPFPLKNADDLRDEAKLAEAFEARIAFLVDSVCTRRKKEGDISAQWDCMNIVIAHVELFAIRSFTNQLRSVHPSLQPVLRRLLALFANVHLENKMCNFVESGMAPTLCESVRATIRDLLVELAPDIVSLVDAFDIPDFFLASALGRKDGKVYETLFEWAKKEQLNQSEVVEEYQNHIKPILKLGKSIRAKL